MVVLASVNNSSACFTPLAPPWGSNLSQPAPGWPAHPTSTPLLNLPLLNILAICIGRGSPPPDSFGKLRSVTPLTATVLLPEKAWDTFVYTGKISVLRNDSPLGTMRLLRVIWKMLGRGMLFRDCSGCSKRRKRSMFERRHTHLLNVTYRGRTLVLSCFSPATLLLFVSLINLDVTVVHNRSNSLERQITASLLPTRFGAVRSTRPPATVLSVFPSSRCDAPPDGSERLSSSSSLRTPSNPFAQFGTSFANFNPMSTNSDMKFTAVSGNLSDTNNSSTVSNTNSGNNTITTVSDAYNDNSYRNYGGGLGARGSRGVRRNINHH
ncbi:hypothetical protein BDQ17DRAFT_1334356 [Cyathus striatus]|nr:hypothetical protein BDQ17DRAFT_1334356 [Cyathus striatus]